jgi:hypothetical protein
MDKKKKAILLCPHVVNQTILSLTYSYLSVISLLLLLCNEEHGMRKYTHDSGEVWYMTICIRIQHLAPRRNIHKNKK